MFVVADSLHTQAQATLTVEINWMAPLMGIVEEFGEYASSFETNEPIAIDSIADMGVYFCDYMHRFHRGLCPIITPDISLADDPSPAFVQVAKHLGNLYQKHLKRFQNIRGMDDDGRFESAVISAQMHLLAALELLAQEVHCRDLYDLTKEVFDTQVAKRNWKKNNKDGSDAASHV